MQHLSWRRYDEEYGLSELLTGAARACVTAHATAPGSFLAAYFTKATRGDRVASLRCTTEWGVPYGAGMKVQLRLFTHAEGVVKAVPLWVPAALSAPPAAPSAPSEANGGSGEAAAGGSGGSTLESVGTHAMRALSYAEVKELEAALRRRVLPALMNIAVDEQAVWDETLEAAAGATRQPGRSATANCPADEKDKANDYRNGSEERADEGAEKERSGGDTGAGRLVPSALCLAFSLAAAIAAATARSCGLYAYVRQLYTAERSAVRRLTTCVGTTQPSRSDEALRQDGAGYVMPQLLIPFFGRNPATAPSAGTVALHTLYVLPGPPLPHREAEAAAGDEEREELGEGECVGRSEAAEAAALGLLPASLVDKLLLASRRLRQRCGGGGGEAGVRADGACIYDAADNLVDAVDMAVSVLSEAGLRPREDYMLGLRICAPCTHVDLAATLPSLASSATTKAKRPVTSSARGGNATGTASNPTNTSTSTAAAATATASETRYGLFPGEGEISGAQLAEYVRQQLGEDNLVSFIEDSHDGQDVNGAYRMQSALHEAPVSLSSRGFYADAETAVERLRQGVGLGLSANLALDPVALRTLSNLLAMASLVHAHGRSVSLATASLDETAMPSAVDLALGLGARYLEVGRLHERGGCAALSRWMERQEQLYATRALRARPPIAHYALHDLPSVPDEPVVELKRKNDKKRKKPAKH